MRLFNAVFLAFSFVLSTVHSATPLEVVERPEWKTFFEQHNAEGLAEGEEERTHGGIWFERAGKEIRSAASVAETISATWIRLKTWSGRSIRCALPSRTRSSALRPGP